MECNIRVDGFSSENSPPVLKQSYAISRDHRLSLKDPEKEQGDTTSPRDWVLGGEWFFIRCARRSREFAIRGKGKLCFKLKEEGQELTVIPSSKSHDGHDVLMLFSAEKPRQKGVHLAKCYTDSRRFSNFHKIMYIQCEQARKLN